MSTAESSASARGATAAQFGFDQRQDKTKANMRPLIEGLRYDHVQRQGKFTDTAKRNLIQNLYRCIEPWEEVWTRGPDPYSGQPVTGRQTNLAHQDLSLDRYGINGPLILHQLQEDGDYERGKHRIPKVRKVRAGRRCGRVLNRMARYYSCKTCFRDCTVAVCVHCFKAADHDGHDVSYQQSYIHSAVCQCGELDQYKDPSRHSCKDHPTSTEIPPPFDPFSTDSENISEDFIKALYDVFTICIQYIISTLQHSPSATDWGKLPLTLQEMTTTFGQLYSSIEPEKRRAGPWAVTIFGDERHNEPEITRQVSHALGIDLDAARSIVMQMDGLGRKTLLVTVDPSRAFYVADMMKQIDLHVTLRHAYDSFMEETAATMLDWIADICQCDVAGDPDLTTKILAQVLREDRNDDIQSIIISPDLNIAQHGLSENTEHALHPGHHIRYTPPMTVRLDWLWQLDDRLWKKPRLQTKIIYSRLATIHPEYYQYMTCRFSLNFIAIAQTFLTGENETDTSLIHFLSFALTSRGAAVAYACRETPLLFDMIEILEIWYRQSERTGTSEEVAVAPDFHLLVPMPPRKPELITPASRAKFVKSLNHIHKRGLFLMSHLRECLWYKEVAQIVRQDRALLERLLQFIDLFDGIQPQRREVAQHLQYEVDWSGVFRTLAELAQTIRRFGECFVGADAGISSLSIVIVARRIRSNELFQTPTLDPAQWRQPEFKKVRPVLHEHNQSPSAGEDMEVIDCNLIRHSLFSFSSPSHYLLGWLIKGLAATDYSFSGLMSGASFTELFLISIEGRPGHGSVFPDTEISDRPLLLLINQPLSKYVITRHIRADLWRRNGRAMRDQQGSYIDRARRDVTFDLEFYILQSALCALGPAHFVGIAIMRFQLEKLFREEGERSIIWNHSKEFTPNMIATALEDFLWMLIWLVTDTDQIKPASLEDFTRKWLIQDLAPSPLLYSEISTRMLDRMNRRIDLPAALAEVSDYRAPTETAPGCYVLHEELMSKVNLLWRHYTRNERDVVLTRIEKFTFDPQADPSRSPDDWYFTPPLPEYPPSPQPFSNLGEIFHSEVAARITHFVVWHCLMMENGKAFIDRPVDDRPHLDQVFSLVIYFAMIAVGVDAEKFTAEAIKGSRIDCPPKQHVANSLFQNLWYISVSDRPVWKPFMPRVKHVLDRMVQHLPPQSAAEFHTISEEMARVAELFKSADKEAGAAEKAKEKAAARQKQLMAEFAKKQADFTALMAEGEDGDESMDEDVVHTDDNTSYGPCIVCQDPVTATSTGGLLALFQPSRTIREAHHDLEYFEKSLETPSSLDEHQEHNLTTDWAWNDDFDELVPVYAHSPESLRFGAYVSACGHLMHEECMEAYSDGTRVRHAQQVARHQPENSIRHEYMCPLCKSIGNFLLPIDFAADKIGAINFRRDVTGHPIALLDHIRAVSHEGLRGVNDSSKVWQDHTEDGRLRCWMADEPARWNSKRKRRQDMRGLNRMIDKYRHLFASLSDQSELMRQSHKSMYMPEDLVGYTISMLEIAQRGMGRSATQRTVVDQIPETSRKVVKKLIEELQLELDGHFGGQVNPTGTGNRETKPGRTTLRVCLFARFLPDWYRASSLTVPLLARDPLSMVIECAAIAPDLLHPVIVMSYYAEVCRALIHITIMLRRCILSWRSHDSSTTADPWQFYKAKDPFTESAKEIFGDFAPVACDLFRNAAPFNDVNSIIRTASKELLSKLLYMYTLPFLRRAAIVFHAVHGNYPNRAESGIVTEGCEYGRLMSLMSINPIASALAETSSVENAMIHRWFSHWAISGRHVPAIESGGPYELLALPECHDDMVNYYEGRVCQHCFQEPTNPGVCLFCRTVVCINGDCCSEGEQGECNLHMRQCGAVVGMFVDLKRWLLLVLYAGTGSWIPMPYLDRHGDVDGGSQKRGHLLYHNNYRFEELRRQIWLGHTIPHIIARKLEGVPDFGGWGSL